MARKHLYPPSVRHGIPRLGTLPRGWTKTTFGEQLRVVERPVALRGDQIYQLISAKRSRGGIVARATLRGDQILTAGQFRVEAGDFITSNRQIIHGACGIVPHELGGAIVSGEYTVMRARSGLHLPFFAHYTHTDYFQKSCFYASVGVDVEKMIFDAEQWLKLPLYLPPLAEQFRIAKILSEIENALSLGRETVEQRRRVRDTAVLAKVRSLQGPCVALGTLLRSIDSGKSPLCPDRSARRGESGVLKLSAVGQDGFVAEENKFIPDESVFDPTMELRPGELLITRANTPELVGLTCITRTAECRLFLSDLILRLRVDQSRLKPAFADLVLRTEPIRRYLTAVATGTSESMRKINRVAIRQMPIPLLPVSQQNEVVTLGQAFAVSIKAAEDRLRSLTKSKTELGRRLLTGELRVKP